MGIIKYLIIGVMFTFIVDTVSNWSNIKTFNTLERIACIVFWPITLPTFIVAFIKGYFKNK
jgi:hypothetical protein